MSWLLFYLPGGLLILQGAFSLVEGIRFRTFVRSSLAQPPGSYFPRASIIAPCKGMEIGLENNLESLFEQEYPDYEIIFVTASADDPSRSVFERLMAEHRDRRAHLVVAGRSEVRGEKVNNLLSAVKHVDSQAEVLVFVDSDSRVRRDWLRSLVNPLTAPDTGAATGYRWYLSLRGGFWSRALSAWNGSVATTLGGHNRNFAWGGSTAIRRDVFNRIGVAELWDRAVSDDYALTRAVQRAGLRIVFVPRCLSITTEDSSLASLLEFTTRQVIITRVYRPPAWWTGLLSYMLFNAVFFGGGLVLLYRALSEITSGGSDVNLTQPGCLINSSRSLTAALFLSAIYLLGSAKGALRIKAAIDALPDFRKEIKKSRWIFCLLWPLIALIFLYNFIRSATTRTILWRGIRYELRSPTDTRVIEAERQAI